MRASSLLESAERRQTGEVGGQQTEGRVEVDVDEAAHLDPVEAFEPATQLPVTGRLPGPGEAFDLRFHRVGAGVDVQAAAVGELRPVGRVERHEVDTPARLSPTAAKASSARCGIVSTVGPVSMR